MYEAFSQEHKKVHILFRYNLQYLQTMPIFCINIAVLVTNHYILRLVCRLVDSKVVVFKVPLEVGQLGARIQVVVGDQAEILFI